MAKQGNILSFDEARARGAVHARPYSSRSYSEQHRYSALPKHAPEQPKRPNYYASSRKDPSISRRHDAPLPNTSGSVRSRYAATPMRNRATAGRYDDIELRGEDRLDARSRARLEAEMNARKEKKSLGHKLRSAKAERQFNKTFGSEERHKAPAQQTSRAAVYEMQMGRSHKRSSKALNEGRQNNSFNAPKRKSFLSIFDPRTSRFAQGLAVVCVTFVLAAGLLYSPVSKYYNEIRQHQQLEAEYAVVSEYCSSLKSEVDYLNTQQGMEEYVRQELGWVKPGEHVVSVSGLKQYDAVAKKGSVTSDLSGAVPTPKTWYSDVLDVVFGYNKP